MKIDAIVPAFNEEQTISSVVRALIGASSIDRVFVIDDGSQDATAMRARAAGATVASIPNGGKAHAMRLGVELADSDPVAFFDADLVGLTSEHVDHLVTHAALGFEMACGMRDYGALGNIWQYFFGPIITGERVVSRRVIDAVDPRCWHGYAIEWGLNIAAADGRVALVPLLGLGIRGKCLKVGLLDGWRQHWSMTRQILRVRKELMRNAV